MIASIPATIQSCNALVVFVCAWPTTDRLTFAPLTSITLCVSRPKAILPSQSIGRSNSSKDRFPLSPRTIDPGAETLTAGGELKCSRVRPQPFACPRLQEELLQCYCNCAVMRDEPRAPVAINSAHCDGVSNAFDSALFNLNRSILDL